jgi:single-strand DNA-binding protein
MASYNRVVLIGNLTRDPEFKQLASGQAVCRLGLAVNRQFKNKSSSAGVVQEVCFIDVDVWGAQAESCRQYLQKGRPILVEGRLKFDSWQDQAGGTRSKHSIVADRVLFLGNQANDGATDGSHESIDSNDVSEPFTMNPNNKVERELMEQLAKAEKKIKASKAAQENVGLKTKPAMTSSGFSSVGEIDFKDQPPFEDELPF